MVLEFFKKNKETFIKLKNYFLIIIFALIFLKLSYIKDPWQDELFTRYLIKNNFGEILKILKNDNNAPLYYYILHFLSNILGKSIFALRVFSILLIILSGIITRKILENLKIKSNLYWTFYLFSIPLYFSSEARSYALIIFLSSLLFYEITGKKRVFPLVVYSTLLNYTHYFSFSYISYFFYDLIFNKNKKNILIIFLIIFLSMPLIFLIKEQPKESLDWTEYFLKSYLFIISFSFYFIFYNVNLYSFTPDIKFFLISILGFYILFYCIKEKSLRYLSFPFTFNFILIFLISYSLKNIYVPFKVEAFFFIPFFLFFLNFILKKGKIFFIFKYSLIFLLILFFVYNFFTISKPNSAIEEIRDIVQTIKGVSNICVIGIWGLTAEYTLEKANIKGNIIIFPPSQNLHLGWTDYKRLKKEEVKYLKEKIIDSGESFLVLWLKSDPYLKDIEPIVPKDTKIYLYNDFYFFYKR